jgi:hypothetical protein
MKLVAKCGITLAIYIPLWSGSQSCIVGFKLSITLFMGFRGLTILKYLFGWIVGISLVTYLCVTIMLDPFVTGTLTMDIGRINFAGIGVTPTGTIDSYFLWNVYE